jgi:peptidoglycan/LPS O-acetylase OafA/YrhL
MDANTWSRIVGQRASVGDLAVHVGLAQTIVPGRSGTINGSLWSIALEAQLYLLFPLLLIIWHRAGATRLLLACSILSVAWLSLGQAGAPDPWGSGFLLPARLVQFTAGMVCAGVLRSGWRPARSHAIAVAAAGLVAAISVSTLELNVIVPLVWIVPSIALVFLATNLDEARGWARATKWLGTVSFSFYLIHQPVQLLLNKPFHQLTENAWALLALGSTAAFAMVLVPAVALHRFVEAPSQRRARNSKPTTLKIRGPREVATALPLGAAT